MANLNFNSEGVERVTFERVPAGDYSAMIVKSEMKHPKGFGGQPDKTRPAFLELGLVIVDGEYKGCQLTERLNLNNTNEMCKKIARSTLATILDAVGVKAVNDSSELHNKPMVVAVGVKPGEGQYGPSNEIKSYRPIVVQAPVPVPNAPAQGSPWA